SAAPLPSSKTARQPTAPSAPLPSGDQLDPSHLAMLLTGIPPAFVKLPPAYSFGPLPSSHTASAPTNVFAPKPPNPPPTDAQLVPSHLAMLFTVTPPASVKR